MIRDTIQRGLSQLRSPEVRIFLTQWRRLVMHVSKTSGPHLLVVILLSQPIEQFFLGTRDLWPWGLGTPLLVIVRCGLVLFFLLALILGLESSEPVSLQAFWGEMKQHLGDFYREMSKLTAALLISFVLVIPGLILMVRWGFVPFLLVREDPVGRDFWELSQKSSRLTGGRFWKILGSLLGLLVVNYIVRDWLLPPMDLVWRHPVAFLLNQLWNYSFAVGFFTLSYNFFLRSQR